MATASIADTRSIAEHVRGWFRALAGMDAEDRGPKDFPDDGEKVVRLTRRELRHLVRYAAVAARGGDGHGSINGSGKLLAWFVGFNTAVTISVCAWGVTKLLQHDTQLTVIECLVHINPQCQVPRGQP